MRILESERILLKPVETEDLEFLLTLRWDKDIMNYLIHNPISMKDQKDWYAGLKKNDIALSIFQKEDGNMNIMGTIGLYDISHRHQRAIWRIRIAPKFQGKGYAKEAIDMLLDYGFNTLNLNKIISDSFAENDAIVNLTLKLGFRQEGLLKEHYFHRGKYRDAIQFGLLREEYNRKK